ncbi:hypothetical protein V8G54_036993 [Vigna mungo]|uniref:Uncharacterized protein n=1 Tax=Vigna mungo TaxID=3915 RepID=A0AAQ3MHR7_VIGMU
MENQHQSSKTSEEDAPLHSIGFEIQDLSPKMMRTCWFNLAHGEALQGAARRGVGIGGRGSCEHSINHLKSVVLGDLVYAEATPSKTLKIEFGVLQIENSPNHDHSSKAERGTKNKYVD